MSIDNDRDPRTVLVREKYFSLHPKPLERWLWQQGLPQAAERVFWLHWEEGMKRGDWCSELALKQVARDCCIDTSTVTRAYQLLKALDLIRREDPGRDPNRPFQQAIAITEVRVPRALLSELARAPNRPPKPGTPNPPEVSGNPTDTAPTDPLVPPAAVVPTTTVAAVTPSLDRAATAALMGKLSEAERAAFFVASRDRRTTMAFDPQTALTPAEQGSITELLRQISVSRPTGVAGAKSAPVRSQVFAKERRLSPLEAARLRRQVLAVVPASSGAEVLRQVLWSVEAGALRRFDSRLAINIALKKIREGAWSRPNRMPPYWLRAAGPEPCTTA